MNRLTSSQFPNEGFNITRITYELFISFVTLISLGTILSYYLLPLQEPVREVLLITDSITALTFLVDFLIRLVYAPRKLKYLVPTGALDLLSGVPAFPILRLLRLPRLILTTRLLRRQTPRQFVQQARQRLAESSLLIVALITLLVMTIGSSAVVMYEANSPEANIRTGEEAVWWALVTMATVGYGDYSPVTSAGRIVGAVMMVVGVSIFSVLTSYIASTALSARRQGSNEQADLRKEIAELRQTLQQLVDKDKNFEQDSTERGSK